MPQHNFTAPAGRIEIVSVDSKSLRNNVLGDPTTRQIPVYLPAGYDDGDRDYPLFVDIVGFTGSGFSHIAWKTFGESMPQRLDRLVAEGKMGPVVLALPDCFTSLGGNQYINSAAMGNWADFLTLEMLPAIESRFRVKRDPDSRALFGKSSGGYGAIAHAMLHAEHWGAIACHSGDMGFDRCYLPELLKTVMHLAKYEGRVADFIRKMQADKKTNGSDMNDIMMLAMAASYDPAPGEPYGVRLPVTGDTCEIISDRWDRWLAFDPVCLIERADVIANLRGMKAIYLDCGNFDQFNLVFGARQLVKRLESLRIPHRYEEFADNHSSVDYRMDISLPYLYERVMAG